MSAKVPRTRKKKALERLTAELVGQAPKADRAEAARWIRRNAAALRELPTATPHAALSPEAERAAKRKRDREREKYRPRSRAGANADLSWLTKPSLPLAQTSDGELVRVNNEHLAMLRRLRGVLACAEPDESGMVTRWDVSRVRAAWTAVYGSSELPETRWQGRLRGAIAAALIRRAGKRIQGLASAPTSGRGILDELAAGCSVPDALTAERIDQTLTRASLGRGGSARRFVKWERAWRDLVDDVLAHSV